MNSGHAAELCGDVYPPAWRRVRVSSRRDVLKVQCLLVQNVDMGVHAHLSKQQPALPDMNQLRRSGHLLVTRTTQSLVCPTIRHITACQVPCLIAQLLPPLSRAKLEVQRQNLVQDLEMCALAAAFTRAHRLPLHSLTATRTNHVGVLTVRLYARTIDRKASEP